MKIVVTQLTRMMKGYFCVAGIDLETRAHVRPVLGGARLRTMLLDRASLRCLIARVIALPYSGRCQASSRDFISSTRGA